MSVRALEPKSVWNHFADLNSVPRPSKKEERVIQFMLDFGASLNLETTKDAIGNVVIKKPATEGMENRSTVILQSHLDMVCQKNNDTEFDFDTQGIEMIVDGDWVKANGTTLGADNGMGVASIMALLSSTDIPHPTLEAMFTIDEETGMTGAKELDPSNFSGKILLNLDTEDDDELSIGCAGGIDTNTQYSYTTETTPQNQLAIQIEVKGLMGGHSGMDIDKGRGNANKLMNRVLFESPVDFHIYTINGGGLRNAIPRESVATITINKSDKEQFESYFNTQKELLKTELATVEKNLTFEFSEVNLPEKVATLSESKRITQCIYSVCNGVFRMSPDFEGLVETSSSLARIMIENGTFSSQSLQRSSVESTKTDVANSVRAPFDLLGANVEQTGDYPGWQPNPNADILKTMEALYKQLFNEAPQVKACHAGLECGILGTHLPETDMISFGPNIRHAHSPDECVQISSVQKFWKFLLATLENTPA